MKKPMDVYFHGEREGADWRGQVNVFGILFRAGADGDAVEGSQAWALANVASAVSELASATDRVITAFRVIGNDRAPLARSCHVAECEKAMTALAAARARIGGEL